MPSRSRATFRLRLEDAVALTFFLLTMGMRVFVKGFGSEQWKSVV